MDEIYLKDPCMGSRRLVALLEREHGIEANRKRIMRLRRKMGIETIWCKPKRTSTPDNGHRKYVVNITRGTRAKYAQAFETGHFEPLPGRKDDQKVEVLKIADPQDPDSHLVLISVLAYHLLSWVRRKLGPVGDMRDWITLRRLLSTHSLTTTSLTLVDGRLIQIRKAGVPDAEQAQVYKSLGIDWKNAFPTRKSVIKTRRLCSAFGATP